MNNGNFTYLKNTDLSEYYEDLIKAQCASEKYPIITKIILRKIVEDIIRKVAQKYDIDSNENIRNLITHIKYNFNICFPEQICKCINTIRFNGINREDYEVENIKIFNAVDLLKMANIIFIWYLKDIEKLLSFNEEDTSLILPNDLDVNKKELEKIINDILSKEHQINGLRERVIDLANHSQNIGGLNRIVIAIKEEKNILEERKDHLSKRIKVYENSIKDVELNYEEEIRELNLLRKKWDDIQTLINKKEEKLVKAEINNQDFKMLVSNFEGDLDEIVKYELLINESLDKLRKSYKNLKVLCKEYNDIIATIKFAYKDEYKEPLSFKESKTRININNEDKLFEEEMIIYFNNVNEAKKNVRILKKIVNDNITKQIKYYNFYKGFLNLRGNLLRNIYILSGKISLQSILINKAKQIIGKSDKDKIDEYINKKLEEIKDVSDEELKLLIYYRFINIGGLEVKCVCNRRDFTKNLDNIVEKAWDILKKRNDFKNYGDNLKSIKIYYLRKIINNIRTKYFNNQMAIDRYLVDDICSNVQKFSEEEKSIIYKGLNIINPDDFNIRNIISFDIFKVIDIFFNLQSKFAYTLTCALLYKLYYSNNNLILEDIIANGSLLKEFFGKTIINDLFILEGGTSFNKLENKQEMLLPLFVFQIVITDEIIEEFTDLEAYNQLSDFWISKQQQYNDLIIYEKKNKMSLIKLINEKKQIELNRDRASKDYMIISSRYGESVEEFKKQVLSSEKLKYLPSYLNYSNLIAKKEENEQTIDEMKEKLGAIKTAISTGLWKGQEYKGIIDSSINNVEKLLVEEAKRSIYFKDEYGEVIQLQNTIEEINTLTVRLKENLKINDIDLKKVKNNLEECRKQIELIKSIYPDMEASYWV